MRPSPPLSSCRVRKSSSSSASGYNNNRCLRLSILSICVLFHTSTLVYVVEGLSQSSVPPIIPPRSRPILVGTSEYSNVLFGKLQRAASLYGTNLDQPMTIIRKDDERTTSDSDKALNKCLWNQFCMADYGPDGVLDEDDLLRPLSAWVPQADLKNDLLFLDGVTTNERSGADGGPSSPFGFAASFFQKKNTPPNPPPLPTPPTPTEQTVTAPHQRIIACAAERGCSHIYVLASPSTVNAYRTLLTLCHDTHNLSSTVLCVSSTARLRSTPGWSSERPQDLEGEMTGAVGLAPWTTGAEPTGAEGEGPPLTLPAEDAAEVLLQIALRTERSPERSPRIVTVFPGGPTIGAMMEERPNRSYFTMIGGKQAKKLAGTVTSVASWSVLLSPLGLGEVDMTVGKRGNYGGL